MLVSVVGKGLCFLCGYGKGVKEEKGKGCEGKEERKESILHNQNPHNYLHQDSTRYNSPAHYLSGTENRLLSRARDGKIARLEKAGGSMAHGGLEAFGCYAEDCGYGCEDGGRENGGGGGGGYRLCFARREISIWYKLME